MGVLPKQLLARGLTAAVEWGSWAGGKEASCSRARELGAAVELHYLFAPADVLFERIERRDMGESSNHARCSRYVVKPFSGPADEELRSLDVVELLDERTMP